LPTNIVLKKQKEEWGDEFDTEKATYEKLKCLQGLVIPICYGQARPRGLVCGKAQECRPTGTRCPAVLRPGARCSC
ncbi:hypothetical protein B0H67DRAFT_478096, partial [Lasiosphaeris hirsuta]